MAVDADVVAAALARTWQHLTDALPGGWTVREGGAVAWVSGVALPTLNGVWAERADPAPDAVAGMLDRVKATGLPYCLQLRPGASPALAELAAARAMRLEMQVPLMVMEDPAAVLRAQAPAGLALRELGPEEVRLHASVAAAGFEVPEELFVQLMSPDMLRLAGVRCYLGAAPQISPFCSRIGGRCRSATPIAKNAARPDAAPASANCLSKRGQGGRSSPWQIVQAAFTIAQQ